MWIIAGLGNPGAEYEHTRHNTGRRAVETLARRAGIDDWKTDKKLSATVARGDIAGAAARLVLPDTFMNKSGAALKPLVKSAAQAKRLIVLHDDLDLPLGAMKLSFHRGSGGHRGLDSVMRALKTRDFIRVRIGISPATPSGKIRKPSGEQAVIDFILGSFKPAEQKTLMRVFARVSDAVEMVIGESLERAMTTYNA